MSLREQFEAWACKEAIVYDDASFTSNQFGRYPHPEVHAAWLGYQVGHAAARAEAEALLREARKMFASTLVGQRQMMIAKIDAYLKEDAND